MYSLKQLSYFNPIVSGIYTTIVFAIIGYMKNVMGLSLSNSKTHANIMGFKDKWIVLLFSLYTLGVIKHGIGYYFTIESNYCNQTSVCEKMLKETHPTFIDYIKSSIGLLGNVWLENVGEGIMFVLVGLPTFFFFENTIIAAFITGVLADAMSDYSGFHKYFCRTSCNVIP